MIVQQPKHPESFVAVAHKSLDVAETLLSRPDVAGACQVLVIALDAVLALLGYPRPSAVHRAEEE